MRCPSNSQLLSGLSSTKIYLIAIEKFQKAELGGWYEQTKTAKNAYLNSKNFNILWETISFFLPNWR